jgi:hypothetical protein
LSKQSQRWLFKLTGYEVSYSINESLTNKRDTTQWRQHEAKAWEDNTKSVIMKNDNSILPKAIAIKKD